MTEEYLSLEESLKRDMADISWAELKVRCPRESLVWVDAELDLLEVAKAVAEDQSKMVSDWMDRGLLRNTSAQDAILWDESQPNFIGVFVKPFALVQELKPQKTPC